MAIIAGTPQLVIGEVGVTIQMATGTDISQATSVIMVVRYPDMITITQLPMTVALDNTTAVRVTLATDFPIVGNYLLELIVTFPNGNVFKSVPQTLVVTGIF
jgi:hypothetical protein